MTNQSNRSQSGSKSNFDNSQYIFDKKLRTGTLISADYASAGETGRSVAHAASARAAQNSKAYNDASSRNHRDGDRGVKTTTLNNMTMLHDGSEKSLGYASHTTA